jgi:thiol-disulfide isomerase/thioredoxin
MKVLSFLKSISLLSFLATVPAFSQKYEISIELKSRNDTVILGHYFAKSDMLRSDDTTILKDGKGVLRGDRALARGVYFIVNDRRKFDILIGDSQQFGIIADTADFVNRTKFTSSPENDAFNEFQRYNADRGKQFQQLNEQYKAAATDADRNAIRAKLQTMNRERIEYIEKLADAHTGSYVGKFLRTLIPPDAHLPEPPKDAQGRITDSTYVYRWYRAHYFDSFNIYDPDLLRTPLYEDKVIDFMTRVIPLHPDTICAEADKILAKAREDDDIFRCVLVTLFNYYVTSKVTVHENVWVHLADKWYIPYATFSSADYLETLKKEVEKKKPNLIGQHAPPMEMLQALPPEHFKAAAQDTAIRFDLYAGVSIKDFRQSVKSKYTAILFWDYSCSHCKKEIEALYQVWEEYKNRGLTVITVQTVISKEAKGKWIDYINDRQFFGWTNAWSPFSNKFKDLYDVSMTPSLFLLDEKGIIIGKRLVSEQIKDLIDTNPVRK